jgi:hypothetical protein
VSQDPQLLPSWRPGSVRDAVTDFFEAATEVAPRDRVACFDNDDTLWCERAGTDTNKASSSRSRNSLTPSSEPC